jgi:3-phosphoshikimate 1-carboxyvinyltransferase
MDLVVKPAAGLSGEVKPPPSKLYTQFATALALLTEGKSTIGPPLKVRDTLALLHAVERLGATVKRTQERWSIWGVGSALKPAGNVVDARNSATTLSLMTSIASLIPRITVLTGDAQLRSRQMPSLLAALRRLGMKAHSTKPDNSPPFVVFGENLEGGKISFGKAVGARHLPALLLPCPYARKKVRLKFAHRLGSPQLELADELMGAAGIKMEILGRRMQIPNRPYQAFDAQVPPDLTAAVPFIAAAALTNSELKLPYQSRAVGRDAVFLDILKKMGVKLQRSRKGLVVSGPQRPRATKVDLSDAPELLPIVTVLACRARGKTIIRGAGEARGMKSDRISAIARELKRMRAKVVERRDGLLVKGPTEFKGGEVNGHNDHAVVTALAVAGLLASGEVRIKNKAEALQTSYSRFVSTFQGLGADMRYAV